MTTLEWVAVIGGAAMVSAGVVGLLRRRRGPAGPPGDAPATASTAAVAELIAGTARRRRHATPSSAASDLRSEVEAGNDARETEVDARHIVDALADVRDACGGEEAVLWRWDESRDALIPASWSTPGAERPRHFRMEDWGPLARWSAEGRLVVFDGLPHAFWAYLAAPESDEANELVARFLKEKLAGAK